MSSSIGWVEAIASSSEARRRRSTGLTGKPPRVTKRRAETRLRLLDAAFRIFANKGFGMVRIDDVCKAAGYTRGAFYSQFDSLDELFFTLYDERASIIAEQVAKAILVDGDTEDVGTAVERVSATFFLDRDWLLIKTDFLLHAARHPDIAERLATHRALLRSAIERQLRTASDHIRPPEAIGDLADTARAVVAAYDGVTVQLVLDGDVPAARLWLTQLLTALLNR